MNSFTLGRFFWHTNSRRKINAVIELFGHDYTISKARGKSETMVVSVMSTARVSIRSTPSLRFNLGCSPWLSSLDVMNAYKYLISHYHHHHPSDANET